MGTGRDSFYSSFRAGSGSTFFFCFQVENTKIISFGFVRIPREIIRSRCCLVLLDEVLDDLTRIVEFVEIVLEHLFLPELLEECLAFS